MNIAKLKVSTLLSTGFGLILFLMALLGGIGIFHLSQMATTMSALSEDRVPKLEVANNWIYQLMETARHTRNMLILDDKEKIRKEIDAVMENKRLRKEFMEQLQKTIVSAEGKAKLQTVVDRRALYTPDEDEYLKIVALGDIVAAKALLLDKMRPAQLEYIAALRKLIDFQNEAIAKAGKQAVIDYQSTRDLMIGLAVFALLIGMGVSWHITRSLLRQLGGEPSEAVTAANRIASGDLTLGIQVQQGDRSSLMFSINIMRDSLVEIVRQVRNGTNSIATASGQIANGNLDLSSRTEQQASTLEETASSMEELTSTVKQNADNARQANQLAMSASDVAVKGGVVVAQVVETMEAINTSSKKIVDIIGVIDGIAFQTNILALNAAVEAARAGEQGRGFAVVASEVRNLAQRSASAAKEIKNLIGDSVDQVVIGSKLVDQAGATMQDIVNSVQRVTDIMGEITSASNEQSAGIEQVNQAIMQMDQVTQQNAALVEEAAAAAQSLQDQAANLAQVVSVFKTREAVDLAPTATRQTGNVRPTSGATAHAALGAAAARHLAVNYQQDHQSRT